MWLYQLLQTDQDRLYLILQVLVNNTIFTLIWTAHRLTIPLGIGITLNGWNLNFWGICIDKKQSHVKV